MENPTFSSPEEEIQYWRGQAQQFKDRYVETKEELDEFQQSSQELEAELEAALETAESKIKDLSGAKCRLEMEVDSLREKLESLQSGSHKQITELEDTLAVTTGQKDELVRYIRELEQANDDLERAKRATVTSLEDFEKKLNEAIERNAFLESELDDKETLAITVQRMKDETRDLHQELAVRNKTLDDSSPVKPKDLVVSTEEKMEATVDLPDNSRLAGPPEGSVDSNRLAEEPPLAQTPVRPNFLAREAGNTPLTPSARISALNIVGDLLRKVGALENKLASCRNYVNNQQRKPGNSPTHSPRAKRVHRGGSSSVSSDVSARSSVSSQQQGVKITV